MIVAAISFMGFSLLFYILFGGADYGAGILEFFKGKQVRKEQREVIARAIGPVWEVNHVWLVLIVVILFMGFPGLYTLITTYLHIPVLLALIGIILRGTTFAFRSYDSIRDSTQNLYSALFTLSSALTPFWLGVTAGALVAGKLDPGATRFFDAYVMPWANGFCFFMGLFTSSLFAFLASVYLIGETKQSHLKQIFRQRARGFSQLSFVLGTGVLLLSWWEAPHFFERFINSWISLTAFGLGTLSLYPVSICIREEKIALSRFFCGFQVFQILLGWFAAQYPVAVFIKNGSYPFKDFAAPTPTLFQLVVALTFGSFTIIPAIIYLLIIFKGNTNRA